MINTLETPLTYPVEPHVDVDGSFVCQRCYKHLETSENKCPKCNQLINWSWVRNKE